MCGRRGVETTVHHLIPREKGGTHLETSDVCRPCHRQIHALFTNAELAHSYHTIESLRCHPDIEAYIKWIRKQPPTTLPRTRTANRRKRKRR
ncbi:HNH endonuclease [Litoribacterium kuwaitense]|uniref:HNH endonuclease n=1 Tax=Litoribacterium kuwaitense TaxID=1398745 RepID=UPI0024834A7F